MCAQVLQKRFWRRKTLMTDLRAGRPFAMRDALLCKLGASTNAFLQLNGAGSRAGGGRGKAGGKVGRKKRKEEAVETVEDEEEEVDEDDEFAEGEDRQGGV